MKGLYKDSQGTTLVFALLLTLILMTLTGAALLFSQSDLKKSSNLKTGTQAFYHADAGIVRASHWLDANENSASFPMTISEDFAAWSYTVTIDRLNPGVNDGKYRIISTGFGPDNARRVIELHLRPPGFDPLGVINVIGDGTHPDFDDGSGGTGSRIPSFSVDGRDHTADGTALVAGDPVSPFSGTESGVNTDITNAADDLRKRIVKRANACPGPIGCDTAGMQFVRDLGLSDRDNDCPGPQCYRNLDLADPRLRATARDGSTSPPTYALPVAPDNRGPFSPITNSTPLVRLLSASERSQLQQATNDIVDLSNALPASRKNCISGDIRGGTHTFGTPSNPMITFVGDPCSANPVYVPGGRGPDVEVRDGAAVNGAGILIVPRRLRLRDASFNWQGIVLVLEDGDFRVGDEGGGAPENSCGAINGAVILQDDQGNDTKVDMDKVGPGSPSCKPFSINLSRAAVANALGLLRRGSWVEKF